MNYTEVQPGKLPKTPPKGVVRLVHTADNHLRVSHSGSLERGQDFFNAAMSVVTIAGDHGAHAIINAGDMLNSPENLPEVINQLAQIDVACQEIELPMYVVQGNHDFAEPSWITVQEQQPRLRPNAKGGTGLKLLNGVVRVGKLNILGLPFLTPDTLRKELELRSTQADEKKDTIHILVWHGSVLEFAKFPSENIITCEDLMKGPWSTVLLGDIHTRQYLKCDNTLIGYPGATELCKRDEPLEHSCTVMDFDEKTGVCKGFEFVPVAHRPVMVLNIGDEQQFVEATAQVMEFAKKEPACMVLIRYVSTLSDVRMRIQQVAGSKAIVRAEAYPPTTMEAGREDSDPSAAVKLPVDYLPVFPTTELSTLARQLCDPDVPVSDLLRNYAEGMTR